MAEEERMTPGIGMGPLAMAIVGVPLMIWGTFHAEFFDAQDESIIIPLALFLAAPILFVAAVWAYRQGDGHLGTTLGMFGGFWASYGALLWLQTTDIATGATSNTALRGLLFATWAVAFAIVFLGSIRKYWMPVVLGATAMFVLLSVGDYVASATWHRVGGWVAIATAIVAWYTALAELVDTEVGRPLLPMLPWGGTAHLRLHTR